MLCTSCRYSNNDKQPTKLRDQTKVFNIFNGLQCGTGKNDAWELVWVDQWPQLKQWVPGLHTSKSTAEKNPYVVTGCGNIQTANSDCIMIMCAACPRACYLTILSHCPHTAHMRVISLLELGWSCCILVFLYCFLSFVVRPKRSQVLWTFQPSEPWACPLRQTRLNTNIACIDERKTLVAKHPNHFYTYPNLHKQFRAKML